MRSVAAPTIRGEGQFSVGIDWVRFARLGVGRGPVLLRALLRLASTRAALVAGFALFARSRASRTSSSVDFDSPVAEMDMTAPPCLSPPRRRGDERPPRSSRGGRT